MQEREVWINCFCFTFCIVLCLWLPLSNALVSIRALLHHLLTLLRSCFGVSCILLLSVSFKVPEYIAHVDKQLNEESERLLHYLDQSTRLLLRYIYTDFTFYQVLKLEEAIKWLQLLYFINVIYNYSLRLILILVI